MNHSSLNNSALFGILMCCVSSIYGITVTRAITVISHSEIKYLYVHCGAATLDIWSPYGVFSWWFEHLLVRSQKEYLVGTWWILSNRTVYVIT